MVLELQNNFKPVYNISAGFFPIKLYPINDKQLAKVW